MPSVTGFFDFLVALLVATPVGALALSFIGGGLLIVMCRMRRTHDVRRGVVVALVGLACIVGAFFNLFTNGASPIGALMGSIVPAAAVLFAKPAWLRVPQSTRKDLKVLARRFIVSSIVWAGIFVGVALYGASSAGVALDPYWLAVYATAGLLVGVPWGIGRTLYLAMQGRAHGATHH